MKRFRIPLQEMHLPKPWESHLRGKYIQNELIFSQPGDIKFELEKLALPRSQNHEFD